MENYHPDWEMETQFLTLDLHPVMDLDSTANSHPIIQEANHPEQILELFDKISYQKGASVLRMLENLMGPEQFRSGVHLFLDQYKYKNAVTDDLWKALEEASPDHLPVKQIMDSWTRQVGYPVLHVEYLQNGKLRLRQEMYRGKRNNANVSKQKWHVPVTWITNESNKTRMKMFGKNDKNLKISVAKTASWVKFNVGQQGYYRVNYPTKAWKLFTALLKADHTVFSPSDRASLLNDAFALAEFGHIHYSIPMDMARYLRQETHLVPVQTALSKLAGIRRNLKKTDAMGLFRDYLGDILEQMYTTVGWADQGTHLEKLTRSLVLNTACKNGLVHCKEEAGRLLLNWIGNASLYIPPNHRYTVYRFGMEEVGTQQIWDVLFERFLGEKKADEKLRLVKGLASIQDEEILERFLSIATNGKVIRVQDLHYTLKSINANPLGSPIVWKFVRSEWKTIESLFSGKQRRLNSLVKSVVSSFSTEAELKEVLQFFQEYPEEGEKSRKREQTIEKIESNIMWQSLHLKGINIFLVKNARPRNTRLVY